MQHSPMFCCSDKASSAVSVGLFSLAPLYTVLTVGHISYATHKAAVCRNWHVCVKEPLEYSDSLKIVPALMNVE